MTAHVQTPAPSIRELAADVPEELASLLERTLAKDPAQRPATPADLAENLEPFCAWARPAGAGQSWDRFSTCRRRG